MGNHDYAGSVPAQTSFSTDPRWHGHVNGTLLIPEADLAIVFVDTPRACPSYMTAPYGDCNENCAKQLANLTDGMPCTAATSLPCWLSHMQWLNATLQGLTQKWKFVAGHHPIDDEHMPYMLPSLNHFGVQAYFAGHVHNLQHVAEKGSLVNFFISGAGAFGNKAELEAARLEALGTPMGSSHTSRGLRHPEGRAWSSANWVEDGPGFLAIDLQGDMATAQFIYHNGSVIYTSQFNATL